MAPKQVLVLLSIYLLPLVACSGVSDEAAPSVQAAPTEELGTEEVGYEENRAVKEQDWGTVLANIIPMVSSWTSDVTDARGHKQALILPFAAAAGFYALLVTLGVVGAKFIGFAALLVGKISLVLSAINGLAKIFSQKQQAPSYAYVQRFSHPAHNFVEEPIHQVPH